MLGSSSVVFVDAAAAPSDLRIYEAICGANGNEQKKSSQHFYLNNPPTLSNRSLYLRSQVGVRKEGCKLLCWALLTLDLSS